MQKTILPRSWQDYPPARTHDVILTNVGHPSPTSMPLSLQDEVPLAKTKSHLPKIEESVRLMIENHVLIILKYKK